MTNEKFCLRWNDFETNISSAFKELRDDKDFFDVTLACDDEQIQAHKVILSACSPFFRNILRRNPHQHPLLYLKGVKYTDLQSVLNFMYHGEVNVAQEELNSFLAVAEDLRVKGLTQTQSSSHGTKRKQQSANTTLPPPKPLSRPAEKVPASTTPIKRPSYPNPPPSFPHPEDDDIQEVVPVKSEPKEIQAAPTPPQPAQQLYAPLPPASSRALAPADDPAMQTMVYQDDSYGEYGQYGEDHSFEEGCVGQDNDASKGSRDILHQYIEKVMDGLDMGKYKCTICGKINGQKIQTENHIESIHFPGTIEYSCKHCQMTFTGRNKLYIHVNRVHKHQKYKSF